MYRPRLLVLAFLFLPVLMGSRCKKTPEPEVVEEAEIITAPEVVLQVISIDPATAPAYENVEAALYGTEFQDGARVYFGEVEAARPRVEGANTIKLTVPALEEGTYDVAVVNPDGERGVLRRSFTVVADRGARCDHLVVYFDFDVFDLQPEGMTLLSENSECLRRSRGTLRVEGHTDERGTTEYNLALGERRANAVRRQLVAEGVTPSRITTVSYGEERPAVKGSGDDAWSRNRRAEILLSE